MNILRHTCTKHSKTGKSDEARLEMATDKCLLVNYIYKSFINCTVYTLLNSMPMDGASWPVFAWRDLGRMIWTITRLRIKFGAPEYPTAHLQDDYLNQTAK